MSPGPSGTGSAPPPDWLGDATAPSPGTVEALLRRWGPGNAPDAGAYFEALGAVLRERPEALRALQDRLYEDLRLAWETAIEPDTREPEPRDASRSPPGDTPLSALPWFRVLRAQHDAWHSWASGLAALIDTSRMPFRRVAFAIRHWSDASHPDNFLATNARALQRALDTQGASLRRGSANLAGDLARGRITMSDPDRLAVGRDLALTPGAVVAQTAIAQLIQYTPRTERVHERPLVVIPPFINKYYVLDLRPENSFVRFALDQGHQVFLVSWRNACDETASATWDRYAVEGVLDSARIALDITQARTFNLVGYCVGGTLAATALATLPRSDRSLRSLTLLTTLLDFRDPGEIGVYVDEQRVSALERDVGTRGIVSGNEIGAAFASLRARELVWHFVEHNYLLGEAPPAFDLLHWNSDGMNIPGPLFTRYLRAMYLDNQLRGSRGFAIGETTIDLGSIRAPAYVLGAEKDHIVPWRGAYESARLLGGSHRFVLTESGHIAGVVNPPGRARARGHRTGGNVALPPEQWFDEATWHEGSWWQDWAAWVANHAGRLRRAPRHAGNDRHPVREPAPGAYVTERNGL